MSQPELAALPAAASMAYVLESVVGPWGSVLVRIGLVISVAGAFLSWTLLAAEIPFRAAKEGMLPEVFAKENDKLVILGAVMGDQVLDAKGVESLAKLPSLDQLRGKLIGLLQAPATKIAGVVQAPASQLARVVSAYASKDAA